VIVLNWIKDKICVLVNYILISNRGPHKPATDVESGNLSGLKSISRHAAAEFCLQQSPVQKHFKEYAGMRSGMEIVLLVFTYLILIATLAQILIVAPTTLCLCVCVLIFLLEFR
jgi:hypothetical protein